MCDFYSVFHCMCLVYVLKGREKNNAAPLGKGDLNASSYTKHTAHNTLCICFVH